MTITSIKVVGVWNLPTPGVALCLFGIFAVRTRNMKFTLLIYLEEYDTMFFDYCCFWVTQLCLTLCNPMDCSMPGFPVLHQLSELVQTHVHWIGDAIQLSHPLSSTSRPASIFPSIRVFSNESGLCIRWSKYWSFSFSISPSNEYLEVLPRTDFL